MREAIEKVIAELEELKRKSDIADKEASAASDLFRGGVASGRSTAYWVAINKLKAVIAEDESNLKSKQHTPES